MVAEFPEKLAFLFEPHRYKVAFGGRGGLKSWGFADALLIRGAQKPTRVLCARENMNSIAESVHHLLETRISALGLDNRYRVEKAKILGVNPATQAETGTEFIFAGLAHNINNIKSLEAVDVVWVEEAATVSKHSWESLIPTIRKQGSEIWVTFNPELATDDTYKRFVLQPPPGAVVVKTSWRDNPWLPDVLRTELEYMRETDPEGYRHVWEGECITEVAGAIFREQMKAADAEGRICRLPIDRSKPVDTFWDLGYGDKAACWFLQYFGGWFNLIDYMDGSSMTVADWVVELQRKPYIYGTDWLPHDGVDAQLHHRMTGDRTKSVEQLMRAAGRKVRVAAKMAVTDRINAARTVFGQVRFDSERCADGIQALRHYQWGPDTALGVTRNKPLHNWASHPSDAFCTMAVSAKQPLEARPVPQQQPKRAHISAWA